MFFPCFLPITAPEEVWVIQFHWLQMSRNLRYHVLSSSTTLLIREAPRETSCMQLNLGLLVSVFQQLVCSSLPGSLLRPCSLPAEIQHRQYLFSRVSEEEGANVHVHTPASSIRRVNSVFEARFLYLSEKAFGHHLVSLHSWCIGI